MSKFAEPMARLIDELKKLPGSGSKSAQRLAFHILRSTDADAEALAAAVRDVKASLRLCSVCNNITDVDPCSYCSDPVRNQRIICVLEEPTNIAAIEKTHYGGVYHVLHGSLSPLHGVGPEHLRIASLERRVQEGQADEVILATNPTVEGEATAV
jgi:recombination protein RecR